MRTVGMVCILGVLQAWASGQTILTAPVGQLHDLGFDSGPQDNPTEDVVSVFRTTVRLEGAAWIRLYFEEVTLEEGSALVITSLLDQAMQHHTARTIEEWYLTSAYFNGDAVEIELFAGPHTTGNRVMLQQVAVEWPGGSTAGGLCGICDIDDRVASQERWTGRLMPVGCTASMYNPAGCFVTAGHCMGFAFVMEFQVPLSNPDGSLQHPGPQDQYPVQGSSVAFVNGGVGMDWGYFTCSANTETGLTAIEAQGEFRPIADILPAAFPVEIEIVGYGVSETGYLSQAQKRGIGPLTNISTGFGSLEPAWFHRVDTTGGNSGSAMLRNGEIIGIVSHCTTNCPNIGTLIDVPEFETARQACPVRRGDCDLDEDVDAFDMADLATCMTGPLFGPFAPGCACLNFDGNSRIDLRDWRILQNVQTGNLCLAPAVALQSLHRVACEGQPLILQADVSANHAASVQWYHNGLPIEGAVEATLVVYDYTADDAGDYILHAWNVCGATFSQAVVVSTCAAPRLVDTFEMDQGWIVVNDPAMVRGQWARHKPTQTLFNNYVDSIVQPGYDSPFDAGDRCFGTGPFGGLATSNDVDGGPTILYSPIVDASGADSLSLQYTYWFYRDNADGDDALEVAVSHDGGETWTPIARHDVSTHAWRVVSIDLSGFIAPTSEVQLRFFIEDAGGETLLEALVDDVRLLAAE